MQAAKEAGYEVTLIFIGVETVETSKDRVRTRVEDGGHDIPEDVQERRFEKSFQNAPACGTDRRPRLFFPQRRSWPRVSGRSREWPGYQG